jgi:hypothetical protein
LQVEFTQEEINALVQLIDIAVKAAGLQVAEASVILTNKLKNATPTTKVEEKTEA